MTKLSQIPPQVVESDTIPMLVTSLFLLGIYAILLQSSWKSLLKLSSKSFIILILTGIMLFAAAAMVSPLATLPISITLVAGIILSFLSPQIAVNILTAIMILRPWDVSASNALLQLAPKTFAGIAMASWALDQMTKGKFSIAVSRSFWLYLFWIFWLFLASLLKSLPVDDLIKTFIPASTIAFLLYNTPVNAGDLRIQRKILTLSLLGVSLIAMYLTYSYSSLEGSGRLETIGFWANANDVGALLCIGYSLVIANLIFDEEARLFHLLLAIFFCICALFTQSRATLLAIAFATGVAVNLKIPPKYTVAKLTLIMVFIGLGGLATLLTTRDSSDLKGSSSSRKALIIAGLRMAKDHPFLGVGVQNFPDNYLNYTSYYGDSENLDAHNSWVLSLAETGVPGFFLFTGLMFTILQQSWRIRHEEPGYLTLVIGYLITMTFLSHTYIFLPYLMGGAVAGASRVVQNNKSETIQ